MKYIVGNWKSNKNNKEIEVWFKVFSKLFDKKKYEKGKTRLVICPTFVHLALIKELVKRYKLPFMIGVQNCSPFDIGSFTGEVSASQIKEYASFVILGHSERRDNFAEGDEILQKKVKMAKKQGLKIVYCVPDKKTFIPKDVDVVAYEPVWAIGSGKTETPQNANNVAKAIKKRNKNVSVLYGGSVSSKNIKGFLEMEYIDGVLPGGASLDPANYWEMIVNASTT